MGTYFDFRLVLWLARIGKRLWNYICAVRQLAFCHCEHQYLLHLQNRTIFLWSACNFEKDCQLNYWKMSPEMKIASQHKILSLQLKWPPCLLTSSQCQTTFHSTRQAGSKGKLWLLSNTIYSGKDKRIRCSEEKREEIQLYSWNTWKVLLDFWALNREVISWWCIDCKASKRRVENNWASFIKVLIYTELSSQCRAIISIFIAQSTMFSSRGRLIGGSNTFDKTHFISANKQRHF